MAGKKIPEETKEKVISLYKDGMSMRKISIELDVDYKTVRKLTAEIEVPTGEKKETTRNMDALQAKEWDFWGAVNRGDLIILTKEEYDALRKGIRPFDTGIGRGDHRRANLADSHNNQSSHQKESKAKKRLEEINVFKTADIKKTDERSI